MPFRFLKYLQPTHYFRLQRSDGKYVYPCRSLLPKTVIESLDVDHDFESKLATDYDLSWQAIMQGYVGDVETYENFEVLSVKDNYRFIRKYFNKSWVFYVLVIRLLSFCNPVKEFNGWYKTRHIKRILIGKQHITYKDYQDFRSSLLTEKPLISVIIPTLNRYDHLRRILADLEKQTYKAFEVIVVDQSDAFNKEFYKDFNLDIQLIHQQEKALWLARNNAIKASKGAYIALSEDDVRVDHDWIEAHLKCIDYFNADVSAGVFHPEGKKIPLSRSYFAVASQLATGNALIHKSVFKKIGLFDRQFEGQRMGDGEFGLRIFLANLLSVSNPKAKCIDVKAQSGGLRELGSWDAFRPTNLLAPRPIPSVIYFYRKYFGNKLTRLALMRTVPISLFSYKLKRNKALLFLASMLSIVISPLLLVQVWRSWRLASKKLNEGAIIDSIDR